MQLNEDLNFISGIVQLVCVVVFSMED